MSVNEIIETIKKYDTIIIHRHVRPDPDALGSQGGLKQIIQTSFPEKSVYAVGTEEGDLTFLTRMDTIDDSLYQGSLVIICDTANSPRIDDQRYNLGEKLIKIDHHPVVDTYGDLRWENTEASSASEMIFELYLAGKDAGLRLDEEAARLLYAGIVGDTGRFMFPNTTKKTFQYAAELVTYSFNLSSLYTNLYSVKDNVSRLKGYILQRFKLFPSGLCIVKLTKEILEEFAVTPSETSQMVNVLSDIQGIKAWAFFIEEEEQIRVRLRSKGPVINKIAEKYNGGGHPLASGATIYNWQEADDVTKDLDEACIQFK
ncbi:DHH family phosphoesterase [Oceanobacillus halophilus]|uniref:Bifunctional oligoribonuclease/PAP phosphatase NrnA n=1 Tax=Oceanobacillus halophilus TaxID=930130 RepID=A0A494ZUC2_9BACI|nr:bifunctional oligoribonuclease/PAP phosphatase NrnA [Oceanobacillus halophilus]RKQ29896.1 bifunctional oligoribonuclease/PAP phosphatase NrnA [Oceanobacillus halophilus]